MIRDLFKRLKLDAVQTVLVDEGRRVRQEVLTRLRDTLRGEVDRIDTRIALLSEGGPKRGPKRGRRKSAGSGRKRKGGTLKDAIVKTLQKAKGALHVNDIADRIKQVGYKTIAEPRNLIVQAYRALADRSLFKKLGRGNYSLKG